MPEAPAPDTRDASPPAAFALVTVTHNSSGALRALLASVARHLPEARVVVVDSGSSDDTVAVARGSRRTATIALRENVGFGRATNRGIATVSEPVAVVVNPDVELVDDSLRALAGEALRRPRLLAPVVLRGDGSRQDNVHPVPAALADAVRAFVPGGAMPGRAGLAIEPWRADRPRRVGWAVGCALAGQTAILRALGPFDERIFLYGEDMELGLRAARFGVPTWFWPGARVVHHGAHASGPAFGGEPFARHARGRHDVVARHFGRPRAVLDDALQAATFGGRIAAKQTLGRDAGRERAQLRAVTGLFRRGSGADGP